MTATQTIAVDYDLPHSPLKVWRLLTEADLLARWLMPNDFKPIIGHRFTFQSQPMADWDGVVQCEVLELVAPTRLRYAWRGGPEKMRIDTTVTWTLTATANGGTRLSLEHAGFRAEDAFAFDGMGRGWRGKVGERLTGILATLD